MAGHSKWANIQHRKGRQDAARSKLFSKLSKEITVAAKMGDPDPDKNPRLRLAVREAKSNSVPKDVIDRAIKKSQSADFENMDEIRYEGYASGGIAVIVEALTDNRNRTASNVRSLFTKYGGNLGESGAVGFLFDQCGLIAFDLKELSEDEVFEKVIEAGADDVEFFDQRAFVYCPTEELNTIANFMETSGFEDISSKIIWKAKEPLKIGFEQLQKVAKLIEALEDDEDVRSVTSNFEASDEDLEALSG
ncbi:MAG: YebC/PmpR family DNA-binding transcriptional regulator [Rhodobacterales bacterium TMED271]|nr:MAG: YebC/PmpR family DNA-binding transcriptional regulator [Rhodobacterales bacterium TMED271]